MFWEIFNFTCFGKYSTLQPSHYQRSSSVGYIEFVETESVARALLLKGQKLLGIPILVELTEAEKNRVAEAQASAATAAEW